MLWKMTKRKYFLFKTLCVGCKKKYNRGNRMYCKECKTNPFTSDSVRKETKEYYERFDNGTAGSAWFIEYEWQMAHIKRDKGIAQLIKHKPYQSTQVPKTQWVYTIQEGL